MLNKLFWIVIFLVIIVSCGNKISNTNQNVTLRDFEPLHEERLELNISKIRFKIDSLVRNDSDGLTADFRTRSYYLNHNGFIWIGRKGIDSRADTVLKYLQSVSELGFARRRFGADQISLDISRWRKMHFEFHSSSCSYVTRHSCYFIRKAEARYYT